MNTTKKKRTYGRWIAVMMILCMTAASLPATAFAAGSTCGHSGSGAFEKGAGTTASPYEITTAEQFDHIREHLTSSFVLKNDIDLSSYANFAPIGIASTGELTKFTGTLNGGGCTVSGLKQSVEANSAYNTVSGLFGYVAEGGSVRNLKLDGFSITVSGEGPKLSWLAVVSGAVGGTLQNLQVTNGTMTIAGLSTTRDGFDVGVIGGSLTSTARFNAIYSDAVVNYNVTSELESKPGFNLTVMGNNLGSAIAGVSNCLFAGTLERTGGLTANTVGFCGTTAEVCSDNYVREGYAAETTYTDRAVSKTMNELKAGSIFTLDSAYWEANAGIYPNLILFPAGCFHSEEGAFTTGNGSVDAPFEITTAEQFDHMRKHLDAHFVLKNDIDLSSFANFLPIGVKDDGSFAKFLGTVDGAGYTVSGMKQSLAGTSSYNIVSGLFAYVAEGGSVKRLKLDDFSIDVSGQTDLNGWLAVFSGAVGGELEAIQATNGTLNVTGLTAKGVGGANIGVIGGSLTNTASFKAIYSDAIVKYNVAGGKNPVITVLGYNGTAAVAKAADCVYTGTFNNTGGLEASTIGFIGTDMATPSNNYVLSSYATEKGDIIGRAAVKTESELKAGDVFALDTAYWSASAGAYPFLSLFPTDCSHTGEGAFTEGNGSAGAPFEISTAAQFNHIREHLTANYVLKKNIDLSSYANFAPIGVAEDGKLTAFTGAIEGAGHTVSGLRQSVTPTDAYRTISGLFGYIAQGGSVRNLKLDDFAVNVSGNSSNLSWLAAFSGAVGGTLQNIQVTNGTLNLAGISSTKDGFDVGVIGGSLTQTAKFDSIYSDAALTYNKTSTDAKLNLTVLGNNGGNAIAGASNCVYVGTFQKSGGEEPTAVGFCGTTTAAISNCYALTGYAAEMGYTDRVQIKTEPQLKAGNLALDEMYWTQEAGSYPCLTTFRFVETTTDSAISKAPSGAEGIFALMGTATGYGAANTIVSTQRTIEEGQAPKYNHEGTLYDMYYSSLLDAYLACIPAVVASADAAKNISTAGGEIKEIRYGIIGENRANRSAVGFKDLYYFDKTALVDQTVPNGDFERMAAMDVDANFELDLADLMSLISNYVLDTPFEKAQE